MKAAWQGEATRQGLQGPGARQGGQQRGAMVGGGGCVCAVGGDSFALVGRGSRESVWGADPRWKCKAWRLLWQLRLTGLPSVASLLPLALPRLLNESTVVMAATTTPNAPPSDLI